MASTWGKVGDFIGTTARVGGNINWEGGNRKDAGRLCPAAKGGAGGFLGKGLSRPPGVSGPFASNATKLRGRGKEGVGGGEKLSSW